MNTEKCDDEVLQNGTAIAKAYNLSRSEVEEITTKATRETGIKIDWYYIGGIAAIFAVGDVKKARDYMRKIYGVYIIEERPS